MSSNHLTGVHKVCEPAAELGGEIELAVGKGPRAAEAAHGVAHGAVDALPHLARHDGAAAVVDVPALVQGQHLQAGAVGGPAHRRQRCPPRRSPGWQRHRWDSWGVSSLTFLGNCGPRRAISYQNNYTTVFAPGEGNFSLFPLSVRIFCTGLRRTACDRPPPPPWVMGRNFPRKAVKNWRK